MKIKLLVGLIQDPNCSLGVEITTEILEGDLKNLRENIYGKEPEDFRKEIPFNEWLKGILEDEAYVEIKEIIE